MADVIASVQGNSNQGSATLVLPETFDPAADRTVIPLLGGWSDPDGNPPVVLVTAVGEMAGHAQPYVVGLVDAQLPVEGSDDAETIKALHVAWVGAVKANDVLALSFLTRRQQA